ESPESLIRYRLLSEPEIVNLLASAPSGSSEEQQDHNQSTANRCSGNSYDAGSSSLSDGSPTTGVEQNGSSSASAGTTTTASSSSSSGTAQSPPVMRNSETVEDVMNRTNQTSSATAQSNMVEV
uniref:Uncharacterized protein n=1 Tax=Anopheles maculatus TaxID=74869 RepID=A0A182SQZ4_9DIPT